MTTFISKYAAKSGLKLVDAKRPIRLTVEASDVAGAKKKNSKCCAFAQAAKRDLGVKAAFFFRSCAWLEVDGKLLRYMLPPSMQKEIVAFDRHGDMQPGEYQLSRPTRAESLVDKRKRDTGRDSDRKAKGARKHKIRYPVRHATTNIRNAQEPK